MLTLRSPNEAYRRIDFDARVAGADPRQLVGLCYEQLTASLGSALFAHEAADNARKSQSLTRALTAITALQLGISGEGGVSQALHQLYEAARRSILDSALDFDPKVIATIRQDFTEISRVLLRGQ